MDEKEQAFTGMAEDAEGKRRKLFYGEACCCR